MNRPTTATTTSLSDFLIALHEQWQEVLEAPSPYLRGELFQQITKAFETLNEAHLPQAVFLPEELEGLESILRQMEAMVAGEEPNDE